MEIEICPEFPLTLLTARLVAPEVKEMLPPPFFSLVPTAFQPTKSPAERSMSPPAPQLPSPTVREIDPLLPKKSATEGSAEVAPVFIFTLPLSPPLPAVMEFPVASSSSPDPAPTTAGAAVTA